MRSRRSKRAEARNARGLRELREWGIFAPEGWRADHPRLRVQLRVAQNPNAGFRQLEMGEAARVFGVREMEVDELRHAIVLHGASDEAFAWVRSIVPASVLVERRP